MSRSLRTTTLLTVSLAIFVLSNRAALGAPALSPKFVSEVSIQGRLRLAGCTVSPQDITVAAYPLEVAMPDRSSRRTTVQRTARVRKAASRVAVSQSNQLTFTLRGIKKGVLYRLFVGVANETCGRVFWRGPEGGLVHAASKRVAIEGFAARSEIEIYEPESATWVGADHLDFTTPGAALRTLRWRSTIPATERGELQISTAPFPISGEFGNCDEPEGGILYRQELTPDPGHVSGEWQTFEPIDFSQIVALPGRSRTSTTLLGTIVPEVLTGAVYAKLLAGSPLYLRVVPTTGGQPACSIDRFGVFGWAMAAKIPGLRVQAEEPTIEPPEIGFGTGNMYFPPSGYAGGHPSYHELAYRAIKPHLLPPKKCTLAAMTDKQFKQYFFSDPIGCLVVNNGLMTPGAIFPAGKWLWFTPKSGSSGSGNPLEGLGGALVGLATGAYSTLGSFVNYLHSLSSEIENTVTGVILKVVQVVDVLDGCSALKGAGLSCKDLVKAGLKIGLTSMGVPPVSIPNWEELQSQGFDYLAASMANEIANATGVPASLTESKLRELVEQATQKALAEITAKRSQGSGLGYDWLLPYAGIEPASLRLVFQKNLSDPLPKTMRYIRSKNALFEGGDTLIPYLFPLNNQLTVPMVLPFHMQGIPNPLCKTDRFLQTTCEASPILSKPVCQSELYQASANGNPSYQWVQLPCESVGQQLVSTYFRDRWIAKHLQTPSVCVNNFGSLFTTVGPINIAFPFPQLLNLAFLRADQWATWSGIFYSFPGCS